MGRDFLRRHVGLSEADTQHMLNALGHQSLDALMRWVLPQSLQGTPVGLDLPEALEEAEALARMAALADENQVFRSFIGMGYYDTLLPSVIQRNVLENPSWYTAYTPYQAEVAQGRLEALMLFQEVVQDLTGFAVSNASLLDEATAAAEAMSLCRRSSRAKSQAFFVSDGVHPQTLAVIQTRAEAQGWEVLTGDPGAFDFDATPVFGTLVQYPDTLGLVRDHRAFTEAAHAHGVLVAVAVDLLALTLLTPPAEWGADIAVGSAQRLGVPMGFGGPHAGYMATTDALFRKMPGRIIGVSRDAEGGLAYRMALQTREQHIRREKATSNVCTAQVLLAVIAALYAVWHGPEGLRRMAERIHLSAEGLRAALRALGYDVAEGPIFDTLMVRVGAHQAAILERAAELRLNLRVIGGDALGVSLDETTGAGELALLLLAFGGSGEVALADTVALPDALRRTTPFLEHPTFSAYQSETGMMRYLHQLAGKDLALDTAMIPLGSCTMKLNSASSMAPITWEGFARLHPFAPVEQSAGTRAMIAELEGWLAEITGYDAVSMQPNSGAQGEYTGLMVIRAWHRDRGEAHRDVCLIPRSAHGTNPASAVLAGMKVVEVACDAMGNIDIDDLRLKVERHGAQLAALMVTYPSTHGVFEERILEAIELVHAAGGQVYMDGANLNAMVGYAKPGHIGSDVSHLNLHKTFGIPHGGGGPGVGPVAVRAHLAPFLPSHPVVPVGGEKAIGPVSAAPYGSALILPISWAYVAMLGGEGLRRSTATAVLSANYLAKRLNEHFPVLYHGPEGQVAHECILECRPLKQSAGVEVDDIAKRLMDYGFHSPTMSFPVPGTLMVEPTESEPLAEIERLVEALVAIREEIRQVETGALPREDNPLKGAPHPAHVVTGDRWERAYPRSVAAYPTEATRRAKYWPAVSRVDNVWGDRNLDTRLPK
ncbi:MAG: aminomethyl-transferring glycine dehydrogenase [Deltaproteobacteria bacterium]|nr:aminomethyl-transferring glycine dehydrogenase [Deltaproteobacteria bacterium]